jgi:hypothetical protein
MPSKIIKHKKVLKKKKYSPSDEEKKKVPQDLQEPQSAESSLSQIYKIINDPRLKNIGSEFLEKLMYLYFIYLAQKGVGATFMAFDSLLSSGAKGIMGLFSNSNAKPREYTEAELNKIRNDISDIYENMSEETKQNIEQVRQRSDSPELSEYQDVSILNLAPSKPLRWSSHEEYETKPDKGPDGGLGLSKGGALNYAAIGAVGKEALKALLLAGITAAVGATAVGQKSIYDKEMTKAQKSNMRLKQSEERAKNWTAEVKNKNQMHNILSEFDDISGISSDSSGLSHFSSDSYGLGLKKKVSDSEQHQDLQKPQGFSQVSKRINDKIREGIKYIYDHSPDKKTIMTFIAVIFALGTALIFANSQSLTDEAINHIMDFSHILSDCANGRITLNEVKAYVEHYLNIKMPRGGGLKKKPPKTIQTPEIKETFYEKRIKPIAKKAYDIITSDESITVAKTLAQIAFLTLVMYGVKEAGTAIYGAVTPSPESMRTARQDLTELAESEIARPTFYTNYTVRDHGKIIEYDKSQYPKYWDVDVGKDNPHAGENYEPAPISKINKILGEATKSSGYMGKVQTENLINTLKEISEYDKKKYDTEVKQAMSDVRAQKITPRDALKIIRNKPTNPHIKNLMLKNKILRETSPKKWDLESRKYVVDKPHPFVEEFREHLPTLKEKINWKKGEMLSGKGLDEGIEYSKTKLKQIAKKIYNTMKSDYGQAAIKGITAATILAGLTALLHSRQHAAEAVQIQLSPEELKEQYMNSIGEDVLFQ